MFDYSLIMGEVEKLFILLDYRNEFGVIFTGDEKEPDFPLEPGETILKKTDKYRAELKGTIGMGSRTVNVVLTNKRLALLPSKAGVLGILSGHYMEALKSGGSKEEIILPLSAISEVKANNFGGGINVVTAEKKYTLDFKALNGFWQKDIKQAVEASK